MMSFPAFRVATTRKRGGDLIDSLFCVKYAKIREQSIKNV